MSTRTSKRSRSGAQTRCPHCQKALRGAKGLKMHLAQCPGAAETPADLALRQGAQIALDQP